jgi:hypothetical protein
MEKMERMLEAPWRSSLSVKDDNPASEPHGLQNPVHPVHDDPTIGMEEVQAEQETRKLVTVKKLCCREDGGWAIEDGAP